MFWKIYFWLLIVLTVPSYFWQGFSRSWEIIDFILFIVAMIGLFAFSWQKKMFTQLFWKTYLPTYIIWNVFYQYFLPLPQKVSEVDLGGLSQSMTATITWIIFFPLIIALYLYGFKRAELWKV